jgi:quinoprotein glucose dehydrogenase
MNPIIVDGVLYGTSPTLKAFALDAATGQQSGNLIPLTGRGRLRCQPGVTYWEEGRTKVLYSFGQYLYALDARTGKR